MRPQTLASPALFVRKITCFAKPCNSFFGGGGVKRFPLSLERQMWKWFSEKNDVKQIRDLTLYKAAPCLIDPSGWVLAVQSIGFRCQIAVAHWKALVELPPPILIYLRVITYDLMLLSRLKSKIYIFRDDQETSIQAPWNLATSKFFSVLHGRWERCQKEQYISKPEMLIWIKLVLLREWHVCTCQNNTFFHFKMPLQSDILLTSLTDNP